MSGISAEWADFLVEVFGIVESEISSSLMQFFKKIGINKPTDLYYLTKEDLQSSPLSIIDRRKLMDKASRKFGNLDAIESGAREQQEHNRKMEHIREETKRMEIKENAATAREKEQTRKLELQSTIEMEKLRQETKRVEITAESESKRGSNQLSIREYDLKELAEKHRSRILELEAQQMQQNSGGNIFWKAAVGGALAGAAVVGAPVAIACAGIGAAGCAVVGGAAAVSSVTGGLLMGDARRCESQRNNRRALTNK